MMGLLEFALWVGVYSAIGAYTHGRMEASFGKGEPQSDKWAGNIAGAVLWPVFLPVCIVKGTKK